MEAGRREEIGFFCRWLLLAVAIVAAAAGVCAAVLGARRVGENLSADIVLPDSIWCRRDWIALTGYLTPSAQRPTLSYLLCVQPDGENLNLAEAYRSRFHPIILRPKAGSHRITVKGVPYGPFTFESSQAMVVIVSPGENVFLVDGGMVTDPSGEDDVLRPLLEMLVRHGWVGCFHTGDLDTYEALREAVRRINPDVAVLCFLGGRIKSMRTIDYAVSALGRAGARRLAVVTTRADLAAMAARRGLVTHLVGPGVAGARRLRNLKRHESAAKLEEYLSTRPIRK